VLGRSSGNGESPEPVDSCRRDEAREFLP
jgi:hypothetical protein